MAVGDIVSDIQSIATGANMDFQPASGVEVMITEIGSGAMIGTNPNKSPDVTVFLYDGTNSSAVLPSGGNATIWSKQLRLFINNSIYLRIQNADAGTQSLSYCGIQTK